MERKLEAGWVQKVAWSVLVVGSVTWLIWVPFFFVAARRGRRSDWVTFTVFAVYIGVLFPLTLTTDGDWSEAVIGLVAMATMAAAVSMLLFTVFDRPER